MSRSALVLALAAALSGALVAERASAEAASRTVDRTIECATGYHGGARVIYVRGQTAYGEGGKLEWLSGVYLATAGQPIPSKPNYRPTLAGLNAGWPPPPPLKAGGLGLATRLCKPVKAKVSFSRRGLIGGAASQLGDDYTCVAPRKLLVRVRATFKQPTALEPMDRSYTNAEGRIERGEIAVTTLAGKPLLYGEVRERGGARLWTTGGCS